MSPVFAAPYYLSVKRGPANSSRKQIEQIPLWASNFMDMGLNAPDSCRG